MWVAEMQYTHNVTATTGDDSGKLFEKHTSQQAAIGYARILKDEKFKDITIYHLGDNGYWHISKEATESI